MFDLSAQNFVSRNGYYEHVMLIPEVSKLVNIAKHLSYIHLLFGFIRIFTPEILWAILEFIFLGCFGVYIFSKNSPIIHYLLYGLFSIFHSGCSILLFYISLLTWKIAKINNNYERHIQNIEKLLLDQPIINRLKLTAISHLICGILCIIDIYLVNKIINLIEEHNQLEIINHSIEEENSISYNNNINCNYHQIPNNNIVEAFSGTSRTLKDFSE